MCIDLSKVFNEKYHTDLYKFEPEKRTEGGIHMVNSPERENASRSLRFNSKNGVKYPFVTGTWDEDPPITIYPAFMSGISTTFRYPADEPTWDENHIKLILLVLEKHGLCTSRGMKHYLDSRAPLS